MSSPTGSPNGHEIAIAPVTVLEKPKRPRFSQKRVREILAELAVPFDPLIIQWKVVETRRVMGKLQGRVIPYADKLAYVVRLNGLFTPTGWTPDVFVHPPVMASSDGRRPVPAKIVITCHLTIHGLGSHSSTGEEWAGVANAATSAEAQALKRACANFGLGLYLYYFFRGVWIDLDRDRRPLHLPRLPEWATPAGWLAGARPNIERIRDAPDAAGVGLDPHIIREIEAMENELGHPAYRQILKRHRVFFPRDIRDAELAARILDDMRLAAPLLLRAAYALEKIGEPAFGEVIRSFRLTSISDAELVVLESIVRALEAKASAVNAS